MAKSVVRSGAAACVNDQAVTDEKLNITDAYLTGDGVVKPRWQEAYLVAGRGLRATSTSALYWN